MGSLPWPLGHCICRLRNSQAISGWESQWSKDFRIEVRGTRERRSCCSATTDRSFTSAEHRSVGLPQPRAHRLLAARKADRQSPMWNRSTGRCGLSAWRALVRDLDGSPPDHRGFEALNHMIVFSLILHGLIGVALLGAITHQAVAVLRRTGPRDQSFLAAYNGVNPRMFSNAVMVLFVANVLLGGILLYPAYRLSIRVSLETMRLGWEVGLFEVKEHFAGIGLASLPLYSYYWSRDLDKPNHLGRTAITCALALIVWFSFIVGHILNNCRRLTLELLQKKGTDHKRKLTYSYVNESRGQVRTLSITR